MLAIRKKALVAILAIVVVLNSFAPALVMAQSAPDVPPTPQVEAPETPESAAEAVAIEKAVVEPTEPIETTESVVEETILDAALPEEEIASPAEELSVEEALPTYSAMMRKIAAIESGDLSRLTVEDQEKGLDGLKKEVESNLQAFLDRENEKIKDLDVGFFKRRGYINSLKDRLDAAVPQPPGVWDKIKSFFTDIFSSSDAEKGVVNNKKKEEVSEPLIPNHPAGFKSIDKDAKLESLNNILVEKNPTLTKESFLESLKDSVKDTLVIDEVNAIDPINLPVIDDVKSDLENNLRANPNSADEGEIIINNEIRQLAEDLDHNPVKILNYVKNNVSFEPYYGAKKGSIGCLEEGYCNDVDTASLTIALLRASGIPARYKKAATVIHRNHLLNLLGVDELRTVFFAFGVQKVPIFILGNPGNSNVDTYDFSQENALALEWTHVEAFIPYDENKGNFDNLFDLSSATSTESLRAALGDTSFTKSQWMPLEPTLKDVTRIQQPILADQAAGFNFDTFWTNNLSYQGPNSTWEEYDAQIFAATGQRVSQNLSTKTQVTEEFDFLPPALPYLVGSGTGVGTGVSINIENFSKLPDNRRHSLVISLTPQSGGNPVFSQTFFASEVNNKPIELTYRGATAADQAVIDSYGGIHATPASLVNIVPALNIDDRDEVVGTQNVSIGDSLLLGFEYRLDILGVPPAQTASATLYQDEKFSVAGNEEGIYIIYSRVQDDPDVYDTSSTTPQLSNSKVLLKGNAAIAREYLLQQQRDAEILKSSLDHEYHFVVARSVVTQNRVLSRDAQGNPTTFDFQGLTMDSGAYIANYSNRGNFRIHERDFRLIWGMMASEWEATIFENIAGLSSVSTVPGMQYAYGSPGTYTVLTINSSTPNYANVINSLTLLSANTRQNMIDDINQLDATIITPDRPITLGVFSGLLYISREPDGSANYAIGEQNGGYSVAPFSNNQYYNDLFEPVVYSSFVNTNNQVISYQDGRESDGIYCNITLQEHNQLISRPDWNTNLGFPCSQGVSNVGGQQHNYIHAAGGTKMFMTNAYNYWAYKSDVKNRIDNYISSRTNLASSDINYLEDGTKYTFKFSPTLGTYIQSICERNTSFLNRNCDEYATVYYVPYQSGSNTGQVYRVRGDVLSKLAQDDNKVIKTIGLPVSDEGVAQSSSEVTYGGYSARDRSFQNFRNGQTYRYIPRYAQIPLVFYTQGQITVFHNNNNGTGGIYGFPKQDPRIGNNSKMYQLFEGDVELEWDFRGSNQVLALGYVPYRCELSKGWDDPIRLGLIEVHGIIDTGVQTIEDTVSLLGTVLSGIASPIDTYGEVKALAQEARKININKVKQILVNTGNTAYQGLLNQYDTSLGSNGCHERTAYLTGSIAGEVLLILVPATKLKALGKAKILNKGDKILDLLPGFKFVEKSGLLKYTMRVSDPTQRAALTTARAAVSSQKGPAGEAFWRAVIGGSGNGLDTPFGRRLVDVFDSKTGRAYEVKNFGSRNVRLTDSNIQLEVDKDTFLMNNDPNYTPVWVFLDQGPNRALEQELIDSGIEILIVQ